MSIPEAYHGLPALELAFPGPLRDRLVTAIRNSTKSATSALALEHTVSGRALPNVGERSVVVDSAGRAAAVIETTAVLRCRLADVPVEHLIADGGSADRDSWRVAHERYWHSEQYRAWINDSGFLVTDDTEVLCITFKLIAAL